MLAQLYGSIDQGNIIETNESIILPEGEEVKVFDQTEAKIYEGKNELSQLDIKGKLDKETN